MNGMYLKKWFVFLLLPLLLFSCNKGSNSNIKKFKNMFVYDEAMPVVNYNIGRNDINFIVDTGSDISIIDDDYYLNYMNSLK